MIRYSSTVLRDRVQHWEDNQKKRKEQAMLILLKVKCFRTESVIIEKVIDYNAERCKQAAGKIVQSVEQLIGVNLPATGNQRDQQGTGLSETTISRRKNDVKKMILSAGHELLIKRAIVMHAALDAAFDELQRQQDIAYCRVFLRRLRLPFVYRKTDRLFAQRYLARLLAICRKMKTIRKSMHNYHRAKQKRLHFTHWLKQVYNASRTLGAPFLAAVERRKTLLRKYSIWLGPHPAYCKSQCPGATTELLEACFLRWVERSQMTSTRKMLTKISESFAAEQRKRKYFSLLLSAVREGGDSEMQCLASSMVSGVTSAHRHRQGTFSQPATSSQGMVLKRNSLQCLHEIVVVLKSRLVRIQPFLCSEQIRSQRRYYKASLKRQALSQSLKSYLDGFNDIARQLVEKERKELAHAFEQRGFVNTFDISTSYLACDAETNGFKFIALACPGQIRSVSRGKEPMLCDFNSLLVSVRFFLRQGIIVAFELVKYNLESKSQYSEELQGAVMDHSSYDRVEEFRMNTRFMKNPFRGLRPEEREYLIGLKVYLSSYLGKIQLVTNFRQSRYYGQDACGACLKIGFCKLDSPQLSRLYEEIYQGQPVKDPIAVPVHRHVQYVEISSFFSRSCQGNHFSLENLAIRFRFARHFHPFSFYHFHTYGSREDETQGTAQEQRRPATESTTTLAAEAILQQIVRAEYGDEEAYSGGRLSSIGACTVVIRRATGNDVKETDCAWQQLSQILDTRKSEVGRAVELARQFSLKLYYLGSPKASKKAKGLFVAGDEAFAVPVVIGMHQWYVNARTAGLLHLDTVQAKNTRFYQLEAWASSMTRRVA